MDCDKRAALLTLYQKRVQAFAHAVDTLHQARDAKWQKGFMRHWDTAHEAMSACITAHDQLESHISTHRCDEMAEIVEKHAA